MTQIDSEKYDKAFKYVEQQEVLGGLDRSRIKKGKKALLKHSIVAIVLILILHWATDFSDLRYAIFVGIAYISGVLIGQGTVYTKREQQAIRDENN